MLVRKLLGLFMCFSCSELLAASFDCIKAGNAIEKMICSDSVLSDLDERLSRQFKKARADSRNPEFLVQEQRKWIAEDRNRCLDVACLTKSYTSRIAKLNAKSGVEQSRCPITEKNLLGGWKGISSSDFEEMAFELHENKHSFLSWLHHRPEMAGTWALENCEIHIADPHNPKLSFDYKITKYAHETLHLQEIGGKGRSIYKKLK